MMPRRFIYFLIILLSKGIAFNPETATGQFDETGLFPVYNFSPKDYNALEQNWCAVQDKRGIMYFGNNQGVLEYDGSKWALVAPEDGSPVHSLAVDENGRIFFGSVNKFGYLEPDSTGWLHYHLLSDLLENENQNFNEIWETHITEDGVIFQSYHNLFVWKNDSLTVIPSADEIQESFYAGGKLFLSFTKSQLACFENGKILPFKNVNLNRLYSIYGMVEIKPGKILVVTDKDGFYELDLSEENIQKSVIRKIETKNDHLLFHLEIFNAVRISPDRISLGTWGNGAILVDTLYNIVSIIDKKAGLQDQIVQGQFCDHTGNLWFALSSGISRVETNAVLTKFADNKGLEGTVQSIARFNKKIYATTNVGLFFLDHDFFNQALSNFRQPVFKPVKGFEKECWDIIRFQNGNTEILLVTTNENIFELSADHKPKKILSGYVYKLYQSRINPNRVYIGLQNGLASIYRTGGKWLQEGEFSGVSEMITSISEDSTGNLWLGTPEEGVLMIQYENFKEGGIGKYKIRRFNEDNGLPEGPFIIFQFRGSPVTATNKGLYRFDEPNLNFFPDSVYNKPFAGSGIYIHRIGGISDTAFWMVTFSPEKDYKYGVGYLSGERPGGFKWVHEPFNSLSEDLIHAIYRETDGIVWLGGTQGLLRFQENPSMNYKKDYNTYIRRVDLSNGKTIFGGAFLDSGRIPSLTQPDFQKLLLPYNENSLVFTYSAQPGENESFNRFSYFLEGNDLAWSEWSAESKKEYTNLREGKYRFRVKSKNIYENTGFEADYEFTVLAPWYRKFWAYVLYVIFAIFIVYLIVKIYTRNLRKIIRERTAEVVAQKAEVIAQKEVIEEKNQSIMDSIMYAEKIQRALLPPEDDIGKLGLDGFILFLPRDVVSGDFYWLGKKNGKIITVAADCTGHGIPGAFMSMLGVAFLNNIVIAQGIVSASEILNVLRSEVISSLKQKGHEGEQKDGMDIALHAIDYDNMKLEFAGANNPLILIRNNELIQVPADRMPIGIHDRAAEPFKNNVMDINKGDVIYTFSDGFQDQFGGPNQKKFMIKKLKELFLAIYQKPMEEQKNILKKEFFEWMKPNGTEQIDDVIVIGIRV